MNNSRFEIVMFASSAEVPKEYQEIVIETIGLNSLTDLDSDFDCKTYMFLFHDKELVNWTCDGGEPEDQSFGRDLNCFPTMIQKAYEMGYQDGMDRVVSIAREINANKDVE